MNHSCLLQRMGRKKKWKKCQRVSHDMSQTVNYDPAVIAEVESLFKKQFAYVCREGDRWELPPLEQWFTSSGWHNPQLQQWKMQLNEVLS